MFMNVYLSYNKSITYFGPCVMISKRVGYFYGVGDGRDINERDG